MARRKKIIITTNKEIYQNLNMLTFLPEVTLKDVKSMQIDRIIRNINKNGKVLDIEKIDDIYTIKKVNAINFKIYLR